MVLPSSSPQGWHCCTHGRCQTHSLFPWDQSKAQGCPLSLGSQLLPRAGTGTGSQAECNSWQSGQRAASISALIPIHAALPVFTRAAARGRLFVPALKPGLFPLPMLCCLLFLPSAFHSGFNSPQTLPNGFFTWGSEAAHRLPKISRTPRAQKGVFSFSHTSLLPPHPLTPRLRSFLHRRHKSGWVGGRDPS